LVVGGSLFVGGPVGGGVLLLLGPRGGGGGGGGRPRGSHQWRSQKNTHLLDF
jgi:hypothetical protein